MPWERQRRTRSHSLGGIRKAYLMEEVSIGVDLEERGFFVYMKMEGEEAS